MAPGAYWVLTYPHRIFILHNTTLNSTHCDYPLVKNYSTYITCSLWFCPEMTPEIGCGSQQCHLIYILHQTQCPDMAHVVSWAQTLL
ncbi:hypothetical protein ACOMHN_009766 [Nucella lapillus]